MGLLNKSHITCKKKKTHQYSKPNNQNARMNPFPRLFPMKKKSQFRGSQAFSRSSLQSTSGIPFLHLLSRHSLTINTESSIFLPRIKILRVLELSSPITFFSLFKGNLAKIFYIYVSCQGNRSKTFYIHCPYFFENRNNKSSKLVSNIPYGNI